MKDGQFLLFKIIELGLIISCIILWEMYAIDTTKPLIVCGTLGGFCFICAIIFIECLLNHCMDKHLNVLISISGCILFIASGTLLIRDWTSENELPSFITKFTNQEVRKRCALGIASMMTINGVVFLLDTIFICRS